MTTNPPFPSYGSSWPQPVAPPFVLWRVASAGRVVGDVPEPQLVNSVASGLVRPDDYVWREGMAAFAPIASIYPFAPYFAPACASMADDAAMRWVLPVGRSPWAIAAGYLGLFSILLVFAPFAIITGVVGIREIHRNPHLHGMGRAIFGIVAGTLGVIALLALALS